MHNLSDIKKIVLDNNTSNDSSGMRLVIKADKEGNVDADLDYKSTIKSFSGKIGQASKACFPSSSSSSPGSAGPTNMHFTVNGDNNTFNNVSNTANFNNRAD